MIGEISPTDRLVLLGVAFAAAFLTRLAGVAISGHPGRYADLSLVFLCRSGLGWRPYGARHLLPLRLLATRYCSIGFLPSAVRS